MSIPTVVELKEELLRNGLKHPKKLDDLIIQVDTLSENIATAERRANKWLKEAKELVNTIKNYDAYVAATNKTKDALIAKINSYQALVILGEDTDVVKARKWCRQHTKSTGKDGSKWSWLDMYWYEGDTRYNGNGFLFADRDVAMLFKLTFGGQ